MGIAEFIIGLLMRCSVTGSFVASRASARYFMIFISSSTRSFFEGTARIPNAF